MEFTADKYEEVEFGLYPPALDEYGMFMNYEQGVALIVYGNFFSKAPYVYLRILVLLNSYRTLPSLLTYIRYPNHFYSRPVRKAIEKAQLALVSSIDGDQSTAGLVPPLNYWITGRLFISELV